MNSAANRLEFAPPATEGLSRPLVLAVLAHLLLVAALTLGVQWRRTAPTVEVQAELWSAVPTAAAPRLVQPPPPPPPPPRRAPVVVAPPPPPAPSRDAQIALERETQQLEQQRQLAAQRQRERERLAEQKQEREKLALEKKREQEKLTAQEKQREQQQRDKERLAAAEKKREQDKLAAEKKREQEKLAAEKKRDQEKLAEEKKREQERLQAIKQQEEAARLEAQRQVNLQRMAGLAGASGAPGSSGTAQKSSGSSSYGGRVSAIVKPNIVFTENPTDNPTALVEVRAAPDGTITARKLVRSSGNKAWDEAVLKAIDKTAVLPRDIDGTVPEVLEINFRRRD